MVLSFYLFTAALQSDSDRRRRFLGAGACLTAYLTLWSYESEFLIVALFPALALWADGRRDRSRLAVAATYWFVAAVYAAKEVIHYATVSGSYQQNLMRADLSHGGWPRGPVPCSCSAPSYCGASVSRRPARRLIGGWIARCSSPWFSAPRCAP
jgi:hypothetical protein